MHKCKDDEFSLLMVWEQSIVVLLSFTTLLWQPGQGRRTWYFDYATDHTVWGLNSRRAFNFFPLHNLQTDCGAHLPPVQWVLGYDTAG
jgi:hypothetical protein